jgi:hypothetical protein
MRAKEGRREWYRLVRTDRAGRPQSGTSGRFDRCHRRAANDHVVDDVRVLQLSCAGSVVLLRLVSRLVREHRKHIVLCRGIQVQIVNLRLDLGFFPRSFGPVREERTGYLTWVTNGKRTKT